MTIRLVSNSMHFKALSHADTAISSKCTNHNLHRLPTTEDSNSVCLSIPKLITNQDFYFVENFIYATFFDWRKLTLSD